VTDVAALIDRTFRTYLEPPDAQPASAALGTTIDVDDTAFVISGFVLPEDEELMRAGVIIEFGSELALIQSYDPLTGGCVGVRGFGGTTAAIHTSGDPVKLSPPYPRQSVFEAVADNIVGLYPELYMVQTEYLATVSGSIAALDNPLAVEVVEIWAGDQAQGAVDVEGRIVDFHPAVGSRALILDGYTGSVWCKFRCRFGDATSEADTWVDLGLESRWAGIVIVGACADLFAGRDLPASHTEWVGNTLQAENIRVGTRTSLAAGLINYRQVLIDRAKSEMRAEYKARTRIRGVTVRSAF
jgi:hypothetical protein